MKKLVDIIAGYDAQVNLINSTHSQTWSNEDRTNFIHSLYYFRKWISEYHQLIIPTDEILEAGTIDDVPKLLTSTFLSS
jgi:hypothetical protein